MKTPKLATAQPHQTRVPHPGSAFDLETGPARGEGARAQRSRYELGHWAPSDPMARARSQEVRECGASSGVSKGSAPGLYFLGALETHRREGGTSQPQGSPGQGGVLFREGRSSAGPGQKQKPGCLSCCLAVRSDSKELQPRVSLVTAALEEHSQRTFTLTVHVLKLQLQTLFARKIASSPGDGAVGKAEAPCL